MIFSSVSLLYVQNLPDDGGTTVRIDPAPPASARLIHLSPDAGPVDVYVNGASTPTLEDIGFLGALEEYVALPQGLYTFDVAPANTSLDDSVLSVLVYLDGPTGVLECLVEHPGLN